MYWSPQQTRKILPPILFVLSTPLFFLGSPLTHFAPRLRDGEQQAARRQTAQLSISRTALESNIYPSPNSINSDTPTKFLFNFFFSGPILCDNTFLIYEEARNCKLRPCESDNEGKGIYVGGAVCGFTESIR